MFALIVESKTHNGRPWSYVAAIFTDFDRALSFGTQMELDETASARLVELAPRSYPFFLCEGDDFVALDRKDLDDFIVHAARSLPRFGPDPSRGEIHLNVYFIDEDYAPSPAGIDAMGSLDHFHVTDATLDSIRDDAPPFFWYVWLDGPNANRPRGVSSSARSGDRSARAPSSRSRSRPSHSR